MLVQFPWKRSLRQGFGSMWLIQAVHLGGTCERVRETGWSRRKNLSKGVISARVQLQLIQLGALEDELHHGVGWGGLTFCIPLSATWSYSDEECPLPSEAAPFGQGQFFGEVGSSSVNGPFAWERECWLYVQGCGKTVLDLPSLPFTFYIFSPCFIVDTSP